MTVTTTASQTTLEGNGATTQFPFDFIAGVPANLVVTYTDASGNETILGPSQYGLVLNPAASGQIWGIGGTVTYPLSGSPIAAGTTLTIQRVLSFTQTTSISNQGTFYPSAVEAALDQIVMLCQQIAARTGQYRGTWASGVAYNVGDIVVDGANGANTGNYYLCAIANTSGTWATDLAAGDWSLAFNVETLLELAQAAAATVLIATSATNNVPIATGSSTLVTQSGKEFQVGMWLVASDANNSANYAVGQVTAYSGTSLTLNVAVTGGSGTPSSWNIGVAGSPGPTGAQGPSTIHSFVNRLRNASLTSWFHGTSGTITTAGGWSAEGIYVVPTGASVTWSRAASGLPTGCPTVNGLTLTGASAVTDLKVRFVLESYAAAQLAGQTCTFQLAIVNDTGGAITPQISTKYPTAQDNWTGSTNDLAATSLQAVANGASGTLCYTFAVNAGAVNGYEIVIDFGNNFSSSGKSVTLGGGFDFRANPGAVVGLNASPPVPEVRDAQSDVAWNRRFFRSTYDNFTAPGSVTHAGMVQADAALAFTPVTFAGDPMRAAPTITFWDGAGNSGVTSFISAGVWTDNSEAIAVTGAQAPSTSGFITNGSGGLTNIRMVHYTADATIIGA